MSRKKSLLRHYATRTGGNVTMVFALSVMSLLGVTGGAIDFYAASVAKSELQDAMDSAVLAGLRRDPSDRTAEAERVFLSNLPGGLTGVAQSYTTDDTSLTGTATYNSDTTLLNLLGINTLPVKVKAKAIGTPKTGAPCIVVLDPTGSQALLVNSGAQITAPKCEIHVKSTANPAAIFNSGSNLNFKKLCLQGTNVIKNSTTVNNLNLGCEAASDPYAATIPTVADSACTASNGNYNSANINLNPGTYCGWHNFNNSNAKVKFAPGLYVIKNGGWNVNGGTWTGTGVTFYFADTSKIQFNSGIAADLSAPTTGTYKGLLFFEKAGLSKSDFIFNNAVSNKMTGLIWLPSRNVTYNAKSLMQSDALSMVMNRLILNNTTWNLEPDTLNSAQTTASGLSQIRLAS